MAFGKRGSNTSRKTENGPRVGEVSVSARSLELATFMARFAIGAGIAVAGYGLLVLMTNGAGKMLNSYVSGHFEQHLSSPTPTPFEIELTRYDGGGNRGELAIHQKCEAVATQAIQNAPYRQDWATLGYDKRVGRIADYIACWIGENPYRFCKTAARTRLVALVHGYLAVQEHELRVVREEMGPFDRDGFRLLQLGTDMGLLVAPDARIIQGIRSLVKGGFLTSSDFSIGWLGGHPRSLEPALSGVPSGTTPCTVQLDSR